MEGLLTESGAGGSVKCSCSRKFLEKTYLMVDDSSTDEMISWSQTNKSFIIRNPIEFSRHLLNQYFKHKNFASIIRQLNSYRFRKISHEQWEFANEYFVKDKPHLFSNIRRKKPVHSHSQGESERLALEEELEKLSIENASIESNISSFKPQLSARKLHVGNLQQRLEAMENRQKNLMNSFQKVFQNPKFLEKIYRRIEFMHSLRCVNKRKFPHVAENSFVHNDNNFGFMQDGNGFAENDIIFEYMDFENIFADNDSSFVFLEVGNMNIFQEEGKSADGMVMGEGENTFGFASDKAGGL